MRPQAPIDSADLAWLFASLCGLLRMPFDARLFVQQFPPPANVASIAEAASALGLVLRPRASPALAANQAPLIALRGAEGEAARLALVLSADAKGALVVERDVAPKALSCEELQRSYDGVFFGVERAPEAASPGAELPAPRFGLGWFWPEILRHRAVLRDVVAASLLLQLIVLATPLCTQIVIDKVLVHHAQSTLAVVVAALGLFVVFNAVIGYVRQYLLLHTGNRIDAVLGMRVFEHLLRLPPRYFEHRPTGTLIARLHGVETVREFLTGAAVSVLLDLPCVLLFVGIMYWYSPPLTAIALALVAGLALLSAAFTPLLRRRVNEQFLAGARNQAFVTEYVSAMDTVKALQLEPQLGTRYAANLAQYLHASFATRHLANVYSVCASALEQALNVAILAVGAWLVMAGEGFTIGMLVAFQLFAARLAQPALRLAGLWQEFQQASIAVQRLGDLMDAPAEPILVRGSRLREGPAEIDIEKLGFAYSPAHAPLFEDFSLRIAPGACAALIGPSGCGKSTLARLLLGFTFPSSGTVRVDGQDTRHLGANELRVQFGVVLQETRLFAGTIYDNLVLAQPHAGYAEVAEACRHAEIHDFIESLPQGYQTPIGEHGAGLSGGQKQRIAIARALLRRPRVLLLDEATASLDGEAAEAIGRTVSRLRGKVTILFIAHRLPDSLVVDATVQLHGRARPALEARHGRVAHA